MCCWWWFFVCLFVVVVVVVVYFVFSYKYVLIRRVELAYVRLLVTCDCICLLLV